MHPARFPRFRLGGIDEVHRVACFCKRFKDELRPLAHHIPVGPRREVDNGTKIAGYRAGKTRNSIHRISQSECSGDASENPSDRIWKTSNNRRGSLHGLTLRAIQAKTAHFQWSGDLEKHPRYASTPWQLKSHRTAKRIPAHRRHRHGMPGGMIDGQSS